MIQFQALSQSFQEFVNILTETEDSVLAKMKEDRFTITSKSNEENCLTHILDKKEEKIIYNFCTTEEGEFVNFQLMSKDLEKHLKLYNQLLADSSFVKYTSSIGTSSAFVFDSDYYEFFFVFNHYLNSHIFGGANHFRFEYLKELIENKTNFKSDQSRIKLVREMMNCSNKEGKTVEDVLENFEICDSMSVINYKEALNCLEIVRNSSMYSEMKDRVQKELLEDEDYVREFFNLNLKSAFESEDLFIDPEELEEILLKISIENESIKSFLMMSFICQNLFDQ